MKIALFLDIIGRDETFSQHGFQVSGQRLCSYETSYEILPDRNSESSRGGLKALNVEHRTSNIERPILMTLRFIDFKTNEPQNTEQQPATSPSVVSSWLKNSGSNNSGESNFER
jgi:hypothetical protein